ncbi:MAG TPA: hypothetical protein VGM26_01330 [Rhizomicrobium sp.]|jgi:hypothetical protein
MRFKRLRSTITFTGYLTGVSALACASQGLGAENHQIANDPYDGGWHFTLTPYLWVPGISGDLKFRIPPGANGSPDVNAGPADVLGFLNFAFMGAADARKGNWSAFTDFIYLDLSGNKARVTNITGPGGNLEIPINLDTKVGLSGFVWTGAISYSVYHSRKMASDIFVGFRDLSTSPSLDWNFADPSPLLSQSGHLKQHQDLWDALIGVRGRIGLGNSHWFIPYYGDVGTGESNFTGQAMGGIGYGFSWGDLRLVYRYLHYEPGQDKLVERMSVHGLALGMTFHF